MHKTYRSDRQSIVNYQDELIVDMERGVVVDSRGLDKDQFTRYFRTWRSAVRPDLNFRQSTQYFGTYSIGQRFLYAQRILLNNKLGQLGNLCGTEFLWEQGINLYGPALAQLQTPLIQRSGAVKMRSQYQVDQIYKYTKNILNHLSSLDLLKQNSTPPHQHQNKIENIKRMLREKYVKPKKAAASQNEQ